MEVADPQLAAQMVLAKGGAAAPQQLAAQAGLPRGGRHQSLGQQQGQWVPCALPAGHRHQQSPCTAEAQQLCRRAARAPIKAGSGLGR